jgi:hypothetical protein
MKNTPMVLTIRKMILQNFQISIKYLAKYKTTFIFVGSYFAEGLCGKVRFFKEWELCPTIIENSRSFVQI